MIRRITSILTAIALMAGLAQAQLSNKVPSHLIKTATHRGTLPLVTDPRDATTIIPIGGRHSWDDIGAAVNETITADLGALNGTPGGPIHVTGIGWNATIETVGLSWASEAVIDFSDAVFLTMGIGDDFSTPPGGINYSSPIVDLIGLGLDFTVFDGLLNLELFESFDDNFNAIDANYLSGELTIQYGVSGPVQPPASMSLGVIGNTNTLVTLDTVGSNFDTELGIYNSVGALLGTNDDIDFPGGNLASEVALGTLPVGTYYAAIGGFNTTYGAGFAVTGGSLAGNYSLNYPSGSMSGILAPNEVKWFSFQIAAVPEPASISLVLCGIGLLAFRRK